MKINIISVGKLKEKYWVQAIAEYSKRLGRYSKLNLIEVADEKCPEKLSLAEEEQVKEKEAKRIASHIPERTCLVTLEIKGKMKSSEELAKWMERVPLNGFDSITFLIGGSLGLAPSLCKKSDMALSFSPMTFPHQMMRVILLEQIYRGFRIIKNEPYHK